MSAYYNEIDPYCCEWLRNLIAAGLIAPGDVDDRSITEVQAGDLRGYTQCHFFAGLGGWSYALRLAGWPDDRPVWTGSAPCQPFSVAGKGLGTADTRHLWPEMRRLVEECRPPVVFGEQVASAEVVGAQQEAAFLVAVQTGDYARANKLAKRLARSKSFHYWRRWADGVRADLGGAGYAWGHAVLGAHSVGAPHIRQRLYWVADGLDDASGSRHIPSWGRPEGEARDETRVCRPEPGCHDGRLADRTGGGQREPGGTPGQPGHADCGEQADGLADAELGERGQGRVSGPGGAGETERGGAAAEPAGGSAEGRIPDAEHYGRGTDQPWRGPDRGAAAGGSGADGGGIPNAGQQRRQQVTGSAPTDETADGRAGWQQLQSDGDYEPAGSDESPWGDTWLPCSDGRWRRALPGVPPLAHGVPRSVDAAGPGLHGVDLRAARRFRKGVLRGAGNAITPQVAAEFIGAYMEACQ